MTKQSLNPGLLTQNRINYSPVLIDLPLSLQSISSPYIFPEELSARNRGEEQPLTDMI